MSSYVTYVLSPKTWSTSSTNLWSERDERSASVQKYNTCKMEETFNGVGNILQNVLKHKQEIIFHMKSSVSHRVVQHLQNDIFCISHSL